jgi:hypothetical protein
MLGILRHASRQAVSYALAFFLLDGFAVSAPAQVTQTVETIEQVTFQKYFLKSGKEMLKGICFLVFHTTFRQHYGNFQPVVGDFLNQGFFDSLVSQLLRITQQKK